MEKGKKIADEGIQKKENLKKRRAKKIFKETAMDFSEKGKEEKGEEKERR